MEQTKLIFTIGVQVMIRELKLEGTVLSVWITPRGTQYEIRYFYNGDAKTVYFYEWELKEI